MALNEIAVSLCTNKIVTVAVITYHSAHTVLETLNSIVSQVYGPENIELIISDDGSNDSTVKVIEEWLSEHGSRFYRVKFFANEVNGGISKNCNIAWRAATSEWIKTIAGDDILLPNCITDNINYVASIENNNVGVICSLMKVFRVHDNGEIIYGDELPSKAYHDFFKFTAEKQYNYLKVHGIPMAPSAFLNRNILNAIGYADERFKLMEDYPLWLNITKNNFFIKFIDIPTVLYRKGESISNTSARLINERFIRELIFVENELVIPELSSKHILLKIRKKKWPQLVLLVSSFFDNKPTIVSKTILNIVYLLKPGYIRFQCKKLSILIDRLFVFDK